jgi:hypothetical protein
VLTEHERGSLVVPRARGWRPSPALIDVAIATLAVLLIASPLLFTSDGFNSELTNDMWVASYQQHMIAAHLHPSLFLQTQQSVFYPEFAFYGGTLFAITGALAVVLGGSTVLAFEAVTLAAIAAAYGGIFWLARQLGVKGLLAHAPAIVFVTSAYYISDPYGRGAWAEFIAVSALPLVLATSLRLARGRWRVAPVACLVAASVVFSGSHNITLLVGSTLAVAALACYWLLSGASRELPWRRMLGVAGLIALGVALNGWFLLPDVSYAHRTMVTGWNISPKASFNTFGVIFDPLRTVPSDQPWAPNLYVQAPVLALIWGLLAAPLAWRERRLRAGVATALIVLAGLLVVIMSSGAWSVLPSVYQQIQFAFRLQTYVALACAALVLLGALALTRRAQRGGATRSDRPLELGLALVVAFSVAVAAWQLWVPNTHTSDHWTYSNRADAVRGPTILPRSWYWPKNEYDDRTLELVPATDTFSFYPAAVANDRLTGFSSLPAGRQPFATNIAGGPYLVHVGGDVRVVGRTEEGNLVLQRTTDGSQPVPVELRAQLSAPVVLGRITTAASAAILLALALVAVLRRRRRRSAARPGA